MITLPAVDPKDTLAVLVAAEAWLSDPNHWTQGEAWRDKYGQPVDYRFQRHIVTQTCAVGALAYVSDCSQPRGALDALCRALSARSIAEINDQPDGYGRIMDGLRRAIDIESGAT